MRGGLRCCLVHVVIMNNNETKREAIKKLSKKIQDLSMSGSIEVLSVTIVGEKSDELYRLATEAGIKDVTVVGV